MSKKWEGFRMKVQLFNKIYKVFGSYYHLKDEYLEKLRRVNAGMLHPGNLYTFDYAIRNLPSDKPIVEIGTFCGLSANTITYLKQKHQKNNLLVTADKLQSYIRSGSIGSSEISYEQLLEFVMDSLKRNLLTFSKSDLPFVIQKSSDEFFSDWEGNKNAADIFGRKIKLGGGISFAYIDGNHSYEFVKNDFKNCDAYLEPGGFILFDDSADYSNWEVKRLIQEVKRNPNYKVIMKNPNYLFQKLY